MGDVPLWVPILVALIGAIEPISKLFRQRKDDADETKASGTVESLAGVIHDLSAELEDCRKRAG